MKHPLRVIDRIGPEDFSATLALQEELLAERAENEECVDALVLVEHRDVYTVGRSVPFQPIADPAKQNVPWVEIGRGGKATYHGPGQLVAYPIFNLARHGKDVHLFLRKLEDMLILCLAAFGITGERRTGLTGIWVREGEQYKKIASIGIGVKRWIAYHGIALNVSTDLSYFQAISPCGQDGALMTSMAELLAARGATVPTLGMVKAELVRACEQVFSLEREAKAPLQRRPSWLKVKAPGSPEFLETQDVVKKLKLVTVCEEAHCPNIGECWSHHTATFMIMGELCTRRCSFCSVKDGTVNTLQPLDPLEPIRVARAVAELGLRHVVVTSVNRDDLPDMGAEHFRQTAHAIASQLPECSIEVLIPDMRGDRALIATLLRDGKIQILNHNVETVPRLYRRVRPGAQLERSLNILRWAKELQPQIRTKSGVMVGLGESRSEVLALMDKLREAGCDIMTIGQYLQPTPKQLPVERFVTPEEFADYEREGLARGFAVVESGPFVRSSYHAWKHGAAAETSSPLLPAGT